MSKSYQNIIQRFNDIPECKGDDIINKITDKITDLQRMIRVEHSDLTDIRTDKAQVTYNSSKTIEFDLENRYLQEIIISSERKLSNYLLNNLDNEHIEMGFKARIYIDDKLFGGFNFNRFRLDCNNELDEPDYHTEPGLNGYPEDEYNKYFDKITTRRYSYRGVTSTELEYYVSVEDKFATYHSIPSNFKIDSDLNGVFKLNIKVSLNGTPNKNKEDIDEIKTKDKKIYQSKYSMVKEYINVKSDNEFVHVSKPDNICTFRIGVPKYEYTNIPTTFNKTICYDKYPVLIGRKIRIEILDYYLSSKVGYPNITFDTPDFSQMSSNDMLQFLKDKYNQYGNLKPEYYKENDIPINIEVKTGKLW